MASKANRTRQPSKAERPRTPPRPVFAITGIITGVLGGIVISIVLEAEMGGPKQVVMLICGTVGVAVGMSVEGLRYGWRYVRWKAACSAILNNAESNNLQ